MKSKLRLIKKILFGNYTILTKEGNTLIVESNLDKESLKSASCLFFNVAHSLQA